MIDYPRPYDATTCEPYYGARLPPAAPHQPLDTFDTIRKTEPVPYVYSNYYDLYSYDETTSHVYQELVSARDYHVQDAYRPRPVEDWTEDDTVKWIIDSLHATDFHECDVPFYNFNITGEHLHSLKKDEIYNRMVHPNVDPNRSMDITNYLYDKLHPRQDHILTELDTKPPRDHCAYTSLDASMDARDYCRYGDSASPESYSGGSNSSEDEEKKPTKRPPGRPKGSGKRPSGKRQKSVSVPEFLRNLLHDPRHCPDKIRFENYAEATFRFVKPDQVAKLWGDLKGNPNMTFEKFSRAMRYHYRGQVLLSVPASRLVYKFGPKGPDISTDNPNFEHLKPELNRHQPYSKL